MKRIDAAVCTVLAGALLWSAPAAGKDSGGGLLEDVDLDARTVTVRERTYAVSSGSELRDARGRPMSLRELEEQIDAWVSYSAGPGTPHPALLRLTVGDDEE